MKEVHELPNGWTNDHFIELLNLIDYEDIDSIPLDELKDMTAMALSDLDTDDVAVILLEMRLGDRLNKGQRQNLAEEFKSDRLWEEYADIQDHEELFNVACMLYWAFPKQYSEPDIVRIVVQVKGTNAVSLINLQEPKASFLARLLNDGMDDHNIIHRLFDDKIVSNTFAESDHIIWTFSDSGINTDNTTNTFTIYTSWNWVDELKGVKAYESTAFADGQLN